MFGNDNENFNEKNDYFRHDNMNSNFVDIVPDDNDNDNSNIISVENDLANVNEEASQEELLINKKNRENYEQLMKDSSTQLDGFWDRDNPFVVVILLILLAIIVIGSAIVIFSYLSSK